LELTAPINQAYAKRWKYSLLIVQGTLVVTAHERKVSCIPREHRSTHNKMQLLQLAITPKWKDRYDYLLVLDADAMMYNFTFDLTTLMTVPPMNNTSNNNTNNNTSNNTSNNNNTNPSSTSSVLLAAQRVSSAVKTRATWKINAGVTLWNLHHPLIHELVRSWQKAALGHLNGKNNGEGDQLFLHHVLRNNKTMEQDVNGVTHEFEYRQGTVIKHIKRFKLTYKIGKTKLDERSTFIGELEKEICQRHPMDCQALNESIKYSEM
jgi:hypothetical protein